jgi:hypothetical protein
MKRLLLVLLVAAIAGASCVRHVELTHADAAVDAPTVPDADVDASTVDASFTAVDAAPDSSIDAL